MAYKLPWINRQGLLTNLFAVIRAGVYLTIIFWGTSVFFPELWARQMAAGFLLNFIVFLSIAALSAFGEWWFHKDIQHGVIFSFMRYQFGRHGLHHGLTIIAKKKPETDRFEIISKYLMVTDDQHRSVFFPWFMALVTFGFYMPILVPLQLFFPNIPFLLGGYAAVTASDICYEILHPLEHQSEEWWEKRKWNPVAWVLRPYIGYLRRFHEYHHLDIRYNMAIAGFFGLPLADIVLGTYKMPRVALTDGALVTAEDIAPPQGSRFSRWHEQWIRERSRQNLESARDKKLGGRGEPQEVPEPHRVE